MCRVLVSHECSNLMSITIPNGVTSIGKQAFRGCSSLTSIIIPSSVIRIERGAFQRCESLASITISNGVTTIKSYAFSGCLNLTTINYAGTQKQWDAISKESNWDFGTPTNKVIKYNYVG